MKIAFFGTKDYDKIWFGALTEDQDDGSYGIDIHFIEANINEDTNIAEELGVSSQQRVAMSASIENEFDVMVPVARFGKFVTIGDLVDYVMEEM